MATKLTLYDKDFYAWTLEQVGYLKEKALNNLDINHLIDEVLSMGAREKRELSSRLELLLMHLLKWKYQPELKCNSWKYTIEEQRDQISYHLEDNPSLKNYQTVIFERAYKSSRRDAAKETGLSINTFPNVCEWDINQVLNEEFFPE